MMVERELLKFQDYVNRVAPIAREEGQEKGFEEWRKKSEDRIKNGELTHVILTEEADKIKTEMKRRLSLN